MRTSLLFLDLIHLRKQTWFSTTLVFKSAYVPRCFSCETSIDIAGEEGGPIKAFFDDYNSFIKPKLKMDSSESQLMKSDSLKRNFSLVGNVHSGRNENSNEKSLTGSMNNNERKTLAPVQVCAVNSFSL